jgi:hypothetical protein
MKSEYRLHGLSPKSSFITVEALEHAAVKVSKTQKAVGQLPGFSHKITGGMVGAVRLMLL